MKFFLSAVISIYIFIYVALSSIGYNIISPPKKQSNLINMLFPQGWVFFTKSPKEEMIDVYKKNSKKEYVRVPLNNSSASSYYGLNRFNRLKQLEFDYILMESKKVEWSTLDSLKFHSKLSIYNRTNINTLNGDLLLVKHKPIPWSWRKNQNIQVEKKYKKINVRNVF